MANVPVNIIRFFADDNLDAGKIAEIRGSWATADFDLLSFIQAYAGSTAFHNETTYKFFTAFDRNLITQNASVLSNDEHFAKPGFYQAIGRMSAQGVKIFEPVRNVFGHQTGLDAANNSYIFKDAYGQNSVGHWYHTGSQGTYFRDSSGTGELWVKDWGAVIPVNRSGDHVVSEVAEWLWNRLIGDGGKNFDVIARAQVHSLLLTGLDFGYAVDSDNPLTVYDSGDINGGHPLAASVFSDHGDQLMDITTLQANEWVGLAVSFISMTPYAFAMEGK